MHMFMNNKVQHFNPCTYGAEPMICQGSPPQKQCVQDYMYILFAGQQRIVVCTCIVP